MFFTSAGPVIWPGITDVLVDMGYWKYMLAALHLIGVVYGISLAISTGQGSIGKLRDAYDRAFFRFPWSTVGFPTAVFFGVGFVSDVLTTPAPEALVVGGAAQSGDLLVFTMLTAGFIIPIVVTLYRGR